MQWFEETATVLAVKGGADVLATIEQIRELAGTIENQAGAIARYPAAWTPEQLGASIALIKSNLATLEAWCK